MERDDILHALFQEYPYLLDTAFVRGHYEAEKIARKRNFPDCTAFIQYATKNSMLPQKAWLEFNGALERAKKRSNIGKTFL